MNLETSRSVDTEKKQFRSPLLGIKEAFQKLRDASKQGSKESVGYDNLAFDTQLFDETIGTPTRKNFIFKSLNFEELQTITPLLQSSDSFKNMLLQDNVMEKLESSHSKLKNRSPQNNITSTRIPVYSHQIKNEHDVLKKVKLITCNNSIPCQSKDTAKFQHSEKIYSVQKSEEMCKIKEIIDRSNKIESLLSDVLKELSLPKETKDISSQTLCSLNGHSNKKTCDSRTYSEAHYVAFNDIINNADHDISSLNKKDIESNFHGFSNERKLNFAEKINVEKKSTIKPETCFYGNLSNIVAKRNTGVKPVKFRNSFVRVSNSNPASSKQRTWKRVKVPIPPKFYNLETVGKLPVQKQEPTSKHFRSNNETPIHEKSIEFHSKTDEEIMPNLVKNSSISIKKDKVGAIKSSSKDIIILDDIKTTENSSNANELREKYFLTEINNKFSMETDSDKKSYSKSFKSGVSKSIVCIPFILTQLYINFVIKSAIEKRWKRIFCISFVYLLCQKIISKYRNLKQLTSH